jgi:hypothetical protein
MNTDDVLDFFDYQQEFLRNVLSLLDERIAAIEAHIEANKNQDPEVFGFYDDVDHIIGVGFVTCQRYITSTCNYWKCDKKLALDIGPVITNGITYASAVNAAANYWKHHVEWDGSSSRKDSERIIATLTNIGVNFEHSLVTGNALWKMNMERLSELLPFLTQWRRAVVELKPKNGEQAG